MLLKGELKLNIEHTAQCSNQYNTLPTPPPWDSLCLLWAVITTIIKFIVIVIVKPAICLYIWTVATEAKKIYCITLPHTILIKTNIFSSYPPQDSLCLSWCAIPTVKCLVIAWSPDWQPWWIPHHQSNPTKCWNPKEWRQCWQWFGYWWSYRKTTFWNYGKFHRMSIMHHICVALRMVGSAP